MKVVVAIALALLASPACAADSIVVLGKLVYNQPMDYVADDCPENYICLRSWWKSVVNVQKTIHGSKVTGRVAAAVMQHTSLNDRFKKSVRLFVLRPIDDPKEREKLRVDYYLESMAEPYQMYCLSQDPKESGLVVDETYVAGKDDEKTYCFELPTS
jgi:hypothetical protein